jgi:hypothetical protein
MRTLALMLLLAPASALAQTNVAIVPLSGDSASAIDDGLRRGLSEVGGYAVQPAMLTRAHLESAAGMGVTCETDDDTCLIKLGVLAETNALLVPSVHDGELRLKLLDVGARKAAGEVAQSLDAGADEAARQAIVRLLRPELAHASLTVVANDGAKILVDGVERGIAPLDAPIAGLAPGPHVVRAELLGHEPSEQRVALGFAAQERVELQLTATTAGDPPDDPGPPDVVPTDNSSTDGDPPAGGGLGVLTISGAALTGLGAIGTASLAAGALYLESEVLRLTETVMTPSDADKVRETQGTAAALWIGTIVGAGVLVVGTAVLFTGLLVE